MVTHLLSYSMIQAAEEMDTLLSDVLFYFNALCHLRVVFNSATAQYDFDHVLQGTPKEG